MGDGAALTGDLGTNPPAGMEILYQDDCLVAVRKPAGVLVHRTGIDRAETRFALQMTRDAIGRHVFPVHRLDKPVSGVLLFALDAATARRLVDAFAGGRVQKTYLAIVRGYAPDTLHIDYPLREEHDRMTDSRADADKPPQPAVTDFCCLARVELPVAVGRYPTTRYSLLELKPKTGRKHQLRRHLKHIGHPIVGDTTHGEGRHNRFFRDHLASHSLLLAATRLSLNHPRTDAPIMIEAAPSSELTRVMAQLGWSGKVV